MRKKKNCFKSSGKEINKNEQVVLSVDYISEDRRKDMLKKVKKKTKKS